MSVLCESSYELPPFPALTHFINHHSHPFSDDTILRCNRKRLESVKLPLSVSQFEAMLAKGAFDQGHYAKLADIAVSLDGVLPTSEPGNILVRLFVSACSMSAMSERIRVAMCNTDITLALAKLKPIPALRELACPQLKLGASQLLPLLARFPGIRRIGYCFAECASDAVSASPSDQEIQDQWLLCSSRSSLVSMELFDTGHTCGPQCIGQAVILLASLLPNLREITVRPHTKVNARALLQNLVQAQQREVYRQRPHVDALKISIVSRAHRFNN
ncbi:hypothetical protein EC988_006348 [Linderina pennispora]|nr:hypothetical protein EC988_006348 [Linderina pennispora]